MPTFDCDLITKFAAARLNQAAGIVDGDDKSGVVLYATTKYTLLGTETVADILNLVYLPAGAVLIPQLSHLSHDGTGATTLTFTVGDAGNSTQAAAAARYATGLAAAGASAQSTPFASGAQVTAPLRLAAPTKVTATIATKTGTITAGKVLCFTIAYRGKS
jgi:hypothetical protein